MEEVTPAASEGDALGQEVRLRSSSSLPPSALVCLPSLLPSFPASLPHAFPPSFLPSLPSLPSFRPPLIRNPSLLFLPLPRFPFLPPCSSLPLPPSPWIWPLWAPRLLPGVPGRGEPSPGWKAGDGEWWETGRRLQSCREPPAPSFLCLKPGWFLPLLSLGPPGGFWWFE